MAKNVSYFDNLKKELKQNLSAYKATNEMSNTSGPGTDAKANVLRKKQDKEFGQLFGALVQGRRYDDKTGKQITASKPKPMTGMAKPVKKAAVKKK
jgi:hypothetical protein